MKLNTIKIKKEIEHLGINYSEFARRINRKRQWVDWILREGADKSHTFNTVDLLAKSLNVEPKDLII
jgi:hypothetical protein